MPRYQCNTCGRVYTSPSPLGEPYPHACAPVLNPAFQPDPTKPGYDPRDTIERQGHRDEGREPKPFLSTDYPRDTSDARPVRAEGRGRRELP